MDRHITPRRIKAIIFDCDGTLVDSEVLSNEIFVEVAAEYGARMSVKEALASFRGGKLADCVAQVEAQLGRPLPEFITKYRARVADAFRSRLRAVPGALELAAALSVPMCVASSGPREKIELSLGLTGLLPVFQGRIFSSYEVGSWKPEPHLFLHAASAMGVAPGDCAVVEDSLPGILAGLSAGMTVFAYQPDGVDPRVPADVTVVKALLELERMLPIRSQTT